MNDDHWNERLEGFREEFNAPPETPRDEVWEGIEAELEQAPSEEILAMMREAYRNAPQAPRDEMWVAIESELSARREPTPITAIGMARRSPTERTSTASRRWTALAIAAAALLVMGVGLGRLSVGSSGTPGEPPAVATTDVGTTGLAPEDVAVAEVGSGTMRLAAADHFSRTESLLTMVSSDARAGRVDAEVGQWARTLLLDTRLLLNSSAARDPMLLELVEDLEVILMQVVALSPEFDGPRNRELDLITEGLEDNHIMLRIRAILPTASVRSGI